MKVFSFTDRLQYGGYGFMMYFYHLLFPFTLCTFYPYESEGFNHNLYPVGLAFMILVMGSMVYFYKKSRVIFFSLGFFIVTVFLVLQFISVGAAVMADRYTYIPYIGLFFGIAFLNKYNIAFWALGIFPALLITENRKIFLNKYLYFSALIALMIMLPNLIWQYQNNFPVIWHMKTLIFLKFVA